MNPTCLWLRGAFVACPASLLLRVVASYLWPAGLLSLCSAGFSLWWLPLLQGMGSRARGQLWWCAGLFAPWRVGSWFSGLGSGVKPWNWQMDSQTLDHQGCPEWAWLLTSIQRYLSSGPQLVARWSILRTSWPVIENHLLPQLPPLLTFLRPDTPVPSSQRMMLRTTASFPEWAESATMASVKLQLYRAIFWPANPLRRKGMLVVPAVQDFREG